MRWLGPLAITALICAFGCLRPSPAADGRALGELHAQQLKDGALTVDEWLSDLRKAQARHETTAAKHDFAQGYQQTIAPARGELAVLVVQDSGRRAGEAIGLIRQHLGPYFRDFAKDMREAIRQERREEFKDALRAFGRELGEALRDVSDGVDALADGVEEQLDRP